MPVHSGVPGVSAAGLHIRAAIGATRLWPACAALGLALWLCPPARAAVTEKGEVRQPRNIYELVYAFDHTLNKILTGDELKQFDDWSPEELKERNPALYDRLSQDVKRWTDEWLDHVRATAEPIPEKKLAAGRELAQRVDGILQEHFASRGWPYRSLRVVFLPPRLFLDERHRANLTGGMFIPYYPDVFFATVDWPIPAELVLVHESLHFNAKAWRYGRPLSEGITETAARDLVVRYDLMSAADLRRLSVYPSERKGVELVLEEFMKRTGGTRDDALNVLLEGYLTDHQERLAAVFGEATWTRLLDLARSDEDWQTHKIRKVLAP